MVPHHLQDLFYDDQWQAIITISITISIIISIIISSSRSRSNKRVRQAPNPVVNACRSAGKILLVPDASSV